MDLCVDLHDNFELVKNAGVKCWILDMQEFVADCTNPGILLSERTKVDGCTPELAGSVQRNMPFTDEADFEKYFYEGFLASEKGIDYLNTQTFGIDRNTGKLKFMSISAQSVGVSTASRAEKLPLREGWDKYV